MLLHARRSPNSVAYHEQLCLTLEGDLDGAALQTAWRELVIRQAATRVAVSNDAGGAPLQVVRRDARPPWRAADWSGLDAEVADRRLQNLLAEDRAQGFDLASGMLLRVRLLRHSPARHSMILSFHHLLLDGWSIPIMLRELLQLYRAARQRRPAALPPAPLYRDYLTWIAAADRTAGEAFWRNRLSGLAAARRLDLPAGEAGASPDAAGEHRMILSEGQTAQLQALAQAARLTMNTLVQGAWALALGRRTPDGDVVFGMTTAGRAGELPGVEQMVGLCSNTLPRRVRLDPSARVTDWLGDLQARQAEEQSHDTCSLVDIQRWGSAPAGEALFDSVVVFENYPVGTLADDAAVSMDEITVSAVASFEEGIDFPLCLVAAPGARMSFRLIFGRQRFDAVAMSGLADDFVSLLMMIAADPERRLAALWPGAGAPYRAPQDDVIDTPTSPSPR
jgi:hypothetical protein